MSHESARPQASAAPVRHDGSRSAPAGPRGVRGSAAAVRDRPGWGAGSQLRGFPALPLPCTLRDARSPQENSPETQLNKIIICIGCICLRLATSDSKLKGVPPIWYTIEPAITVLRSLPIPNPEPKLESLAVGASEIGSKPSPFDASL